MKRTFFNLIFTGAFLAIACEGRVGPIGLKSLMNISDEHTGVNCQHGGLKIESGIDENKNELLDSDEVDNTNYVCNGLPGNNGNDGDGFDKITILDFGYNYGTTSSDWTVAQYGVGLDLYNFNIDNYPGVDSVVFIAFLGTNDVNSKCFVELFNKTDNLPINNSILESNRFAGSGFPVPYEMKQTGNIYNDLPRKEITLTFRIKSETAGVQVHTGFSCYLYLYKRT
jgi:hypothetical protein